MMVLTTDWMAATFTKFNKEIFHGELPTPRFIIIRKPNVQGQCGAKNWKDANPDFEIKLSNYDVRTEYQYQCTLLHEMIHLYWQSKGEWDIGHGEKFVEMALRFRKLGWAVAIPDSSIRQRIKDTIKPANINNNPKQKFTSTMIMQNNDSTAVLAQASIKWENIWCNQASTGIQLHCKFCVDNMKDIPCEINVSFHPDMLMNDGTFYHQMLTRNIPPIILKKKTLNLPYASTTCNDLMFEISYESMLLQENDSLLSKMAFKKEMDYVVVFQIIYEGSSFPNMAFYMLSISGKKGLFKNTEYIISRAEITQAMSAYIQKEESEIRKSFKQKFPKCVESDDSQSEEIKTVVTPKPIKIPVSPLSQTFRQLMNDRILSPADEERIMHMEREINKATSKFNFPWDEIYDPNEEFCISNALMRLIDERYIRDSTRVRNLMLSLRKKGL